MEETTAVAEDQHMKNLVGKTVTYAHYCDEHGWVFEFDDSLRVYFGPEGAEWYKRLVN